MVQPVFCIVDTGSCSLSLSLFSLSFLEDSYILFNFQSLYRMDTRHVLKETVRQTTTLLENMRNKLMVVEDMNDTLLKIMSMIEDKEDMDEVEPIIMDSTSMMKKLMTAIDMVCKVLMEVREEGSLVELVFDKVEEEKVVDGEIPHSLRLDLASWPRRRAEIDLARIDRLHRAVTAVNQIF